MYPSTPPETGRDAWADGNPAGPGRTGGPGHPTRGAPPPPGQTRGPMPPAGPARGGAAVVPQHGPGPRGYPPGPGPDGYPGGPGPDRDGYPGGSGAGPGGFRSGRSDDDEPESDPATSDGGPDDPDGELSAGPVPVRRLPSLIVAGFALLIGVGLVFGAQTSAPGARLPFALVVLGVQLLFVLAWTLALRPPALLLVAGVSTVVAASANAAAVLPDLAALAPLGYVAAGGFLVGVLGQLVRAQDRARVTESLGATLFIILGVVAFATLIVLSRRLLGTQAIFVCLTATAVALAVARFTDAVLPWPRPAPQVPRGALGVVIGAMCGTLAGGIIGIYLVGFTPTSGAVVGLVAGSAAVLADLAVGYIEAGRQMAGEAPTMWIARHMQGPLGGFALAAPVAYGMSVLIL